MGALSSGGRSKTHAPPVVAALAGRQHGVVARRQLIAAGVSGSAIVRLTRSGWLTSVHRGVHRVAVHRPNRRSRWMAAVLASGDGALLSHASGAALWGLTQPTPGPVHVTVPRPATSAPASASTATPTKRVRNDPPRHPGHQPHPHALGPRDRPRPTPPRPRPRRSGPPRPPRRTRPDPPLRAAPNAPRLRPPPPPTCRTPPTPRDALGTGAPLPEPDRRGRPPSPCHQRSAVRPRGRLPVARAAPRRRARRLRIPPLARPLRTRLRANH